MNSRYALGYMNGMKFSTSDRDQDADSHACAQEFHGAWWYKYCYVINPNGMYLTPGTYDVTSMNYLAFMDNHESLRSIKLMFR